MSAMNSQCIGPNHRLTATNHTATVVGVFAQPLHDTTIMQATQNKEMVNYPLFPFSHKVVKDSFLGPTNTIISNLKHQQQAYHSNRQSSAKQHNFNCHQ